MNAIIFHFEFSLEDHKNAKIQIQWIFMVFKLLVKKQYRVLNNAGLLW